MYITRFIARSCQIRDLKKGCGALNMSNSQRSSHIKGGKSLPLRVGGQQAGPSASTQTQGASSRGRAKMNRDEKASLPEGRLPRSLQSGLLLPPKGRLPHPEMGGTMTRPPSENPFVVYTKSSLMPLSPATSSRPTISFSRQNQNLGVSPQPVIQTSGLRTNYHMQPYLQSDFINIVGQPPQYIKDKMNEEMSKHHSKEGSAFQVTADSSGRKRPGPKLQLDLSKHSPPSKERNIQPPPAPKKARMDKSLSKHTMHQSPSSSSSSQQQLPPHQQQHHYSEPHPHTGSTSVISSNHSDSSFHTTMSWSHLKPDQQQQFTPIEDIDIQLQFILAQEFGELPEQGQISPAQPQRNGTSNPVELLKQTPMQSELVKKVTVASGPAGTQAQTRTQVPMKQVAIHTQQQSAGVASDHESIKSSSGISTSPSMRQRERESSGKGIEIAYIYRKSRIFQY